MGFERTCGQELVEECLGAVSRAGLELGLGGGMRQRVVIVDEEVAEVEGVGDRLGDGYGAAGGGFNFEKWGYRGKGE